MLAHATERVARRGQTVFQRGDEGSHLVAVLSGRVRISAASAEGREVTLDMIEAGEVFGEIALLDGKPRSADATAIEDSHLMMVERRRFLPHLMANQALALRLIGVLCARLRDVSDALGDVATLDLPGRLASKLLTLADEYGEAADGRTRLRIRLSHTDLGRFIGCSRESVNKQMRAWEEGGVLAREDGHIILRRPGVLRSLSGEA